MTNWAKTKGHGVPCPYDEFACDQGRTKARPYKARERLEDGFGPVFEGVFYLVEELVGDGAVDDAVVVA